MTATEKLKEKGLKVTPQRLAIYKRLMNTKTHPTAEMIYNEIVSEYPSISLATVYKTLGSLKLSGLVDELSVSGGCIRYDADTRNHAHLICTGCNSVFDVELELGVADIRSSIKGRNNFFVEKEQMNFYGLCGECNK